MRIVIDMQGAQSLSRFRGIGRYSLSFAKAVVRNRGEHDIILALSSLLPDAIEPLRTAFDGLLPQDNIRVWQAPGPVLEKFTGNDSRRETAELIREAFLASLGPDVIHISSLFEGYVDDSVTSIGRFDRTTPVSVSLYDLIPLLNPDHYLKPNPPYARYYERKIAYLKQAAIYLSISEFTRREGLAHLDVPEERIINVSTAMESHFQPLSIDDETLRRLREKFNLTRPFILYTGGDDQRKNLPRLIQAFAALPASLRANHQLVLAGGMLEDNLESFNQVAKTAGIKPDELCFTGYVTDEELVLLYNLCKLFVFPSWHEGFGLPALEAMACGAPVIGANTSSLPEVIRWEGARFDPLDVAAITAKMIPALENDEFRMKLRAHGLEQAKQFSWDESAKRAIAAWESRQKSQQQQKSTVLPAGRKLKLAFVSPMPPEQTGIADYSAELLPALAEHYDIDIIVAQDQVDDASVNGLAKVHDIPWLLAHADEMDRVLYHFGNSPFHRHMLSLVQEVPGTVMLHDFYMSELMHWLELHAGVDYAWTEALYLSHGYSAVRERYHDADAATRKYPVNLHVLQHAQGIIVHSEYSQKLVQQWYGKDFAVPCDVIPLLRLPSGTFDKADVRKQLGIDADDFVVCSFGFLNLTKLNHRLLNSWRNSVLVRDTRCRLIFVGENTGGEYGAGLLQTMRDCGCGDRISITGFVSLDTFRQYLKAADVAVQIRTNSRGETSAAVLDCMNHALPTIINAHGSMAEFDPEAVWMLPDEFDDAALVEALETLWREPERRHALGERAHNIILNRHTPAQCAIRFAEAIERFHHRAETATPALIRAIAAQKQFTPHDAELLGLSKDLAATLPLQQPARRLFLDVTATYRNDLKTGIERVARSLLLALLNSPPSGCRIEPVYLSDDGGEWHYRHARHYTLGLLGCPQEVLDDECVEPGCGDILLGLDLSGDTLVQAQRAGIHKAYRKRGVAVYAVIFDLLPVRMPEAFPQGAERTHEQWLRTVSTFDGAACISKAVADDLAAWQTEAGIDWKDRRPFRIGWFHLGADVTNSSPSQGLPVNAASTLRQLQARPSFLMIGTIEPRKGYLQTVEAFNELWNEGIDVNLVIVGKEGWIGLPDDMRRNIPKTVECLQRHHELNKRLFWLNGISDEYLDHVYAAGTCLIAASVNEGFGLPLIEAARHHIPIVARDIPVFREVAGGSAFYFTGEAPGDLASSLKTWLGLYHERRHPGTDQLHWLTWQESAEQIKKFLFRENILCRQLLVDVSELVQKDAKSGIQRVVRSILSEWLNHPPAGYRVEPVYATEDQEYRYARRFTHRFLNSPDETLPDEPVACAQGDIFFGLDFQPHVVFAQRTFYQALRRQGVRVQFAVYDLLSVMLPQHFPAWATDEFARWLEVVAESDGAVCISRTVANELACWLKENESTRHASLKIDWFHLGADVEHSVPTTGLPDDAKQVLDQLNARLSFLIISTLEPRKGHHQVLEAFEQLWQSGMDVNLVIVGKQGWLVEQMVKKIRLHPELDRRLFWLDGISDEYLEKVYAASTCLIAASEGEGFGLFLIEAARHGLPIIARDLPVFREVAGNHAFYYNGSEPQSLANALWRWIELYRQGEAPKSEGMPRLTWEQSAGQLLKAVLE